MILLTGDEMRAAIGKDEPYGVFVARVADGRPEGSELTFGADGISCTCPDYEALEGYRAVVRERLGVDAKPVKADPKPNPERAPLAKKSGTQRRGRQ